MSSPSQPRRRFSWRHRAAPDRQRPYRPVVEHLEDRCLLAAGYAQVNLASDVPGLARVTDPNLVNPWGAAFSPTGPFWFADNGSGVSDVLDGRGRAMPLVVKVPSAGRPDGTPTGTVFNGGAGFMVSENGVAEPSRFLFATADGTIAGWSGVVDPTRAFVVVDNASAGAVYTGLALAADPAGHRFLYGADFRRGTVDVFDPDFRPVVRPGSFQDPDLPDGFAPSNVQAFNDRLFVTYARQDEDGSDSVAGPGNGFLDVYDTDGRLVRRFASGGALDAPWGLAVAPADFGPFGGALLVGNNGDGRINAYDPGSGTFLGQLADDDGIPLAIPDLWALTFGNGHAGGDAATLFFTAGVDDDAHGLFGAVQAPGRRGADTGGPGAFDPSAPGEPGDYPLPPRGGPAFRAGNEASPIPLADLLPLKESSLVLVPTLSTASQPGTRVAVLNPATPIVGVRFQETALAGVSASDTLPLLPAEGNSPLVRGAYNDPVPLYTFLDLNTSAHVPPKKAEVQRPDFRPSALADHDGGAEGVLAQSYTESRLESADERAVENGSVAAQDGGGRTKPMNLLVAVGIAILWAGWLRLGASPRPRSRNLSPAGSTAARWR
jgi:uncharacterized protein (TIGR03118 family)